MLLLSSGLTRRLTSAAMLIACLNEKVLAWASSTKNDGDALYNGAFSHFKKGVFSLRLFADEDSSLLSLGLYSAIGVSSRSVRYELRTVPSL